MLGCGWEEMIYPMGTGRLTHSCKAAQQLLSPSAR